MRFINFLYFLLLAYIVAALVFWGMSLNKQSHIIFKNELSLLRSNVDSFSHPDQYKIAYKYIQEKENARKRQFMGEGVALLLVTLIGAGVVFTSIRGNQKLSSQQTNFMLSVTHELKSPIAAIKLNMQTMAKRKLTEEMQQQLLERSIREADRLDDLCNNLLLATQMESSAYKPMSERINVSALVIDSLHLYEGRSKHDMQHKIQPDCYATVDSLLWKLAVNNLLENALKYTPPEETISVQLYQADDELILSVADTGDGIADEEKRKIFKKFYRVGNENARKTKGTGLGLYLTSRIIKGFNGTILVRDNQPHGSVFEITIPSA